MTNAVLKDDRINTKGKCCLHVILRLINILYFITITYQGMDITKNLKLLIQTQPNQMIHMLFSK